MTNKFILFSLFYHSNLNEDKKLKCLKAIQQLDENTITQFLNEISLGKSSLELGKDLAREFKSSLIGITAGSAAASFTFKLNKLKNELADCYRARDPKKCRDRINRKMNKLNQKLKEKL